MFVFAPSSQASRGVLKREGFKDAQTLEMLLGNDKMQEKTKGQIVWVDEAGLVSSVDMRRLMDVAKRNGNRVILSGDYTQHSSVEAGDAFRLLEKEAGVKLARLTEIRRQKMPGYKKAVEAISEGTGRAAQKGFDAVDKMGWVIESGREERHGQLVSDYLRAVDEGKSALIIAPTHREGERLTDELRQVFKERGAIGKEREFKVRRATAWTDAQKGDVRNYEPGMVLEWHKHGKGIRGGRKGSSRSGQQRAIPAKDGRQAGGHSIRANEPLSRYSVPTSLSVGKGDRIRITKNGERRSQAKPTLLASITATFSPSRALPSKATSVWITASCCRRIGATWRWAMSIPPTLLKVRRLTGFSWRSEMNRSRPRI